MSLMGCLWRPTESTPRISVSLIYNIPFWLYLIFSTQLENFDDCYFLIFIWCLIPFSQTIFIPIVVHIFRCSLSDIDRILLFNSLFLFGGFNFQQKDWFCFTWWKWQTFLSNNFFRFVTFTCGLLTVVITALLFLIYF